MFGSTVGPTHSVGETAPCFKQLLNNISNAPHILHRETGSVSSCKIPIKMNFTQNGNSGYRETAVWLIWYYMRMHISADLGLWSVGQITL